MKQNITVGKAKVKKWKPFMSGGELKKWKKEASPQAMLKPNKRKKMVKNGE